MTFVTAPSPPSASQTVCVQFGMNGVAISVTRVRARDKAPSVALSRSLSPDFASDHGAESSMKRFALATRPHALAAPLVEQVVVHHIAVRGDGVVSARVERCR